MCYLTRVRIVTESDIVSTGTVALPYRITESQMEIAWDEIHFNNHVRVFFWVINN